MKMKNNAFRGFPAVWNGVVFAFFVFQPPEWFVIATVLSLAVLTFLPVAFIHPVRVERWRPLTLAVTLAWFLLAGLALAYQLDPPDAVKLGFAVTCAYLSCVAAVQQLLDKLKI